MEFLLLIGLLLLFPGIYCLYIALRSRSPENLGTAVGTLTKVISYKNVRTKYGSIIPNVSDYSYCYTVSGKTYLVKGSCNKHKRFLPQKAPVFYIKGFPAHACLEHYQPVTEWALAASLLFGSASCIGLYILELLQ